MKSCNKLFVILLLVAILISPISASAALKAGITPDSSFYFLDLLFEKINLVFIFNPEKEARKAIEYADERLAEAEEMANKNKPKEVEKATIKYEESLELATEKSGEIKEKWRAKAVLKSISENTAKHQEVLNEILDTVAQEARSAVEYALEVSKQGQKKAVQQIAKLKEEVASLKKDVEGLKEKLKEDSEKKSKENEKFGKEIDDWKTYTNSKYTYSIKYPTDWRVFSSAIVPGEGMESNLMSFGKPKANIHDTPETYSIGIFNRLVWTKEDIVKTLGANSSLIDYRKVDIQDIEINGIKASKVVVTFPGAPNTYPNMSYMAVIIEQGEKVYEIYNTWPNKFNLFESFYQSFQFTALESFIKVLSPNGEEIIKAGNVLTIIWYTSSDIESSSSDIYLISDPSLSYCAFPGDVDKIIDGDRSNKPGFLSFNGDITKKLGRGNCRYKVKIVSTTNPDIQDISDDWFSIVEPDYFSITVVSPNGGEKWTIGKTYTIKWNSSGIDSDKIIKVEYRPADRNSNLGSNFITTTPNTGSYTWTIPNTVTPNQYLIEIIDYDTNSAGDQSDTSFNIDSF